MTITFRKPGERGDMGTVGATPGCLALTRGPQETQVLNRGGSWSFMLHQESSVGAGAGGPAWDKEENTVFLGQSARILDASSSHWTLRKLSRGFQSVLPAKVPLFQSSRQIVVQSSSLALGLRGIRCAWGTHVGVGRHLCGFYVQGRVTSSDLAGVQDAVETLASMQSGPGQCAVWTSTGKKTFQSFCPR